MCDSNPNPTDRNTISITQDQAHLLHYLVVNRFVVLREIYESNEPTGSDLDLSIAEEIDLLFPLKDKLRQYSFLTVSE